MNRREILDFQSNWNFFIYFLGNKAIEDKGFNDHCDSDPGVLSCLPSLLPTFIPYPITLRRCFWSKLPATGFKDEQFLVLKENLEGEAYDNRHYVIRRGAIRSYDISSPDNIMLDYRMTAGVGLGLP